MENEKELIIEKQNGKWKWKINGKWKKKRENKKEK